MAASALQLKQITGSIQGKIATVLSALQIGDVTRQRIEHVMSMLESLDSFKASEEARSLDGEVLLSMYIPYLVVPSETMTIVVHAANDSVAAGVRQELHKLDADLGVAALKPLGTILDASIGQRSFTATLLAIFAAIALLVATSGIYSVLAYSVNERAGEISLRIGLGANRSNVIQHFVGGGVRLIAFGIALGSVIALIVTQLLSSLLFGVTASDPGTFLAIAAFVMMAGVLACYLPARRASLLNPLVVWQRR